ncbi:hypothetical protein Leryth_019689 [Lithospermum erythrorhizon]|nr:hypothetical protein Leryth_019689 [Lithospermum erythrorhizon]
MIFNGLLCFSDDEHLLTLWNPSIRSSLLLPKSDVESVTNESFHLRNQLSSFALVIIKITMRALEGLSLGVKGYSCLHIKSGKWMTECKSIPSKAYTKPFHPSPTPSLASDGRVHCTSSLTYLISENTISEIGNRGNS